MGTFLSIRDLSKYYGHKQVLHDINMDVKKGDIVALLGPSGGGKTTLLNILAGIEGMEKGLHGTIHLGGADLLNIPAHQRPTNMMFQSYALFPNMTVRQNIAFGLYSDHSKQQSVFQRVLSDLFPRSIPAIEEMVDELMGKVRLTEHADKYPSELSGGQQQRVALARAMAQKPALLLLDEPMGALDKHLRAATQRELRALIKGAGLTCIMVTHDQEEAMSMADTIAVMMHGTIAQYGTPMDVYDVPCHPDVASFMGEANLFHLFRGDALSSLTSSLPRPDVCDTAMIRPEDIHIERGIQAFQPNGLHTHGTIVAYEYQGSYHLYTVTTALGDIKAKVNANYFSHPIPALGDTVTLACSPDMVVFMGGHHA